MPIKCHICGIKLKEEEVCFLDDCEVCSNCYENEIYEAEMENDRT